MGVLPPPSTHSRVRHRAGDPGPQMPPGTAEFPLQVGSVLNQGTEGTPVLSSLFLTLHFCLDRNFKQKKRKKKTLTPSQSQSHSLNLPHQKPTPSPRLGDFSLEGSIVINGILKARRGPCVCGRGCWTGTASGQAWGDAITPSQRSWDGQGQRGHNTRWLFHRTNPACPTRAPAGLGRAARHPNLLSLPGWDGGKAPWSSIPAEAAAGGAPGDAPGVVPSLCTLLLFPARLVEHLGASSQPACSASDAGARWLLTLGVLSPGSPRSR